MEQMFHRAKWLTNVPKNAQVNVQKTVSYVDKI